MPLQDLAIVTMIVFTAACAAGAIFCGWHWMADRGRITARMLMREAEDAFVFLFDDIMLVDATPAARAVIRGKDPRLNDWDGLVATLAPRFPRLRSQLADLADRGQMRILPDDDAPGWIQAEFWEGLARITYSHDTRHDISSVVDEITLESIEDELETLRGIGEDAPQAIWKQDIGGRVTWANSAYLALLEKLSPTPDDQTAAWPPQQVFDSIGAVTNTRPVTQRISLDLDVVDGRDWYDVTSIARGSGSVHFAVSANGRVRAEKAQRTFVQTLTKTFAQLSIGLAIFDRKRQLAMFNPALLDLTRLPVDFLASRPDVTSVLDRLRENRMLPEPKNYGTWRDQLAALETAAQNGTYCETWNLPDGQTFRVTGRPHPDGAIAFLFEDISAEMSLTRRFRSQLETGQAVIDTLDEAIAVFSATGTLTMSNTVYARLWTLPLDDGAMTDTTLRDEIRLWQSRCAPTSVWADLRPGPSPDRDRGARTETIWLENGRRLSCRINPLPDGAMLIGFAAARGMGGADKTEMITEPKVLVSNA